MLTHTTAAGVQQEMTRRQRRSQDGRSDGELTKVTVNWKRIGTGVAGAIAGLMIVAAGAARPTDAPSEPAPAPAVTTFDDTASVGKPAAPSEEEPGAQSSVPLFAS